MNLFVSLRKEIKLPIPLEDAILVALLNFAPDPGKAQNELYADHGQGYGQWRVIEPYVFLIASTSDNYTSLGPVRTILTYLE